MSIGEVALVRFRLVIATCTSVALVLAAPYVGMVRSQIRAACPGQFGTIMNGLVAASLIAAVVWGLTRIRAHRLARYVAMAVAFILGAAYAGATASPDPAVRAVEHFHFVEYGLITVLFYRAWGVRHDASALVLPVLATFIVGIADEAVQWFIPARVGELQDLWLNAVATGCGLLFAVGLEPPVPFVFGWRPGSARKAAYALATVLCALAAFVHLVHLGVEIRDPMAGVFASRYTTEQLGALRLERAASWRLEPPMVRPPRVSREDQYMTEGLQHVQARNTAWGADETFVAWRENLILEAWFGPVLDTPSYVSASGHRWSAAHRADAAARVQGSEARSFTSAAYPYPLYFWRPEAVWLVSLAAAALLLAVGTKSRVKPVGRI